MILYPKGRTLYFEGLLLKTRFFGLHCTRRKYRCIFNRFYVMGPKSYRVRRNNAKYTAITPLKVIQGHRFCYQSKAHMRLLISNDY